MNNSGRINRFLAFLLSLCMLVSIIPISAITVVAADAPTTISTVAQLEAFRDAVNGGETYEGKTVTLTENLDLSGVENWTPIGGSSHYFKGTFDGGNHVIYNLTINTDNRYCGLFGRLYNATLKNLGLENVRIVSGANDVAGLAGNAQGGTIERCYVTGSVQGRSAVSGILGSTHSSSYPTTIKNCYARVALTATGSTKDIAGISGWNGGTSVKIENCFSACIGEVRPIAGWSDGSPVQNAQFVSTYFDMTLSPNFSTSSGRADLGRASAELKTQSTYDGWDFDSVWAIESGKNGGYPYLRGFTPGLGGAPGSVCVTVTDSNGNPITDVNVSIKNDETEISLDHQGGGVYSGAVTTSGVTYDIYVNGEKVGEVSQTDTDAAVSTVTVPDNTEPEITAHTNHTVCGNGCTHDGAHSDLTFTEWTSATSLPSAAGAYYLTQDITLAFRWKPAVDITLCLNGHTISLGDGKSGIDENIEIQENGSLSICDCRESAGKIQVVDTVSCNAVNVNSNATFNLYNGTLASKHLPLMVTGTANIYGGTVLAEWKGIWVYNGTCSIFGGTVKQKDGANAASLIEISRYGSASITAKLYISGGTFSASGCNVLNFSSGEVHLSGGDFITDDQHYAVKISNSGYKLYLFGTPTIGGKGIYAGYADSIYATDNGAVYSGDTVQITAGSIAVGSTVVREVSDPDKFTLTNEGKELEASENNLILALQTFTVTLPTGDGYTVTGDTTVDYDDSKTYTFALHDGYYKTSAIAVKVNGTPVTLSKNGTFTLSNVKENKTITVEGVALDTTAPTANIYVGTSRWESFLNTVTFGLFFKHTQTVTVTAADNETGIYRIYYLLSDAAYSDASIKDVAGWTEITNGGSFNINPDNKYIVYVKAVDQAGNETYISSDGIVLDQTAPLIDGIADGGKYYDDMTFTVSDSYLDTVTIDGVAQTLNTNGYTIIADNREHTVAVTDKAGNETKLTITVHRYFTVTYLTNTGFVLGTVKYGVTESNVFPAANEFGIYFPQSLAKLKENGSVYVKNPIWYADADLSTSAVMPTSPADGQNVTVYCGLSTNTGISNITTADHTYGGDEFSGYKAGSNYSVNWYTSRSSCLFNFVYEKKVGDEWKQLDDSYKADLNGTQWDNMITLKTVADSGYYRLKYIECTAVDHDGNALFKEYVYPDASENEGRQVTVKPRALTISGVTATDRVYNGTNTVTLTGGTLNGIINNDAVGFTLGSGTMADADAGSGKAVAVNIELTGTDAGNYTLTQPTDITVGIRSAEQTVPAGLIAVNETISGKADGKITGVTTAMEYRSEGETAYTAVTGNETRSLAAGKYYVRYASNNNYNASADTEVVIGVGRRLTVTVPAEQVGYTLTVSAAQLDWHGEAKLTFTLNPGYSKLDNFAVTVTGAALTDNGDGTYTLSNAENDVIVTVTGVADDTPPTAAITIKSNGWRGFLNTVTFGLFFKDTVDVTITAADADIGSGLAKVEYLLSESRFETEDAVTGTWTEFTAEGGEYKFSIQPNRKAYVYVRVTDNAGNMTVINSEGVVVYTDAAQDTESITFTKLSGQDVPFSVTLNGNTVKAVYLGMEPIDAGNYTVSGSVVTLKAAYLQTLAASDVSYKLRVEYNPMGEAYADGAENEAPASTTVNLTVNKVIGTVSVTNDPGKTYDGTAVNTEYMTNNVSGEVIKQYKAQGADDSAYTTEAPKNAGGYTVRVTVKADTAGNCTEAVSAPVNFTIAKKDVTIDGTAVAPSKAYDGKTDAEITAAGTLSANFDGENLSIKRGTAAYSDKNVGTSKTVTFSGFELQGTAKDNYNLTAQPASVTAGITAVDLTVNVTVSDKQYDGLNAAVIASAELVGVVAGDTVVLTNGTPAFTSVAAGNDIAVHFTDFSISGDDAANYNLIQPRSTANIYNTYAAKQDIDYVVNESGWIHTDFEVTAQDGYELSIADVADSTWSDTLTVGDETADGKLMFYVRNKATGAISQQTTEIYKIDKTPATGEVSISGVKTTWDKFLETITFGLHFNDAQRISVTADDNLSGVAKIEYYEVDKSLTLEEIEILEDSVWTEMSGSVDVSMQDAKRFIYYFRLTDTAGNVSYIATDGAEYDITAPAISGVNKDATYYTTQSVTVTDKNLKSVTVNGVEVEDLTNAITLDGNRDAAYEIVATDMAGNVTTAKVTMKKITELSKPIDDIMTANVKPSDKSAIEEVRKQLEAIDTLGATSEEKAEIQKQIDRCNELLEKIGDINNQTSSPQTGDNGNIALWFMLAVLSLAGLIVTTAYGKKRKVR